MGKWVIQREEALTECEEPHPMRLGRNPQHYRGELWERDRAIREGKQGYLCPGLQTHSYPLWVVYKDETNEQEAFDVYKEAVRFRDRMNAEDNPPT